MEVIRKIFLLLIFLILTIFNVLANTAPYVTNISPMVPTKVVSNSVYTISYYIWDAELDKIKTSLQENGSDIIIEPVLSKLTAFGNLILANDKAALVSAKFTREETKQFEDIFDVEVERGIIANYHAVGSVGVVTNKGGLVHPEATDEELEWLEGLFKVDFYVGTANMGVPFVGSCMIANSFGVVVGHLTSGPEIVKIEEALGFLG